MRIPDSLVEKLLHRSGKFNKEQLASLRRQEVAERRALQDVVIKSSLLSEQELTRLYADEIDVPYVKLQRKISLSVLRELPERIAREYNAVVFDIGDGGTKLLAMSNPDDKQALSFLQKQLGHNVRVYTATNSQIAAALNQYPSNLDNDLTKLLTDDAPSTLGQSKPAVAADTSQIARIVDSIIAYGINAGASDIHIEPRQGYVIIRYRIDGLLREANKLPLKILESLVSRIKLLADLRIDEHRTPQDGHFKIRVSATVFALEVTILPIIDGEKVVIRIFDESTKAATFQELGFWGHALSNLQHAIVQPHGMILLTGPIGSGKSTTLFSILNALNTTSINISTIEDPIEYRIPGASQTQVNTAAGISFHNGLRVLLRQDPNIIMVGEIRDTATAELITEISSTGHLVFTTLHTRNAVSGLSRLADMGVKPFLIASSVRIVLSQRLVRRLCIDCREIITPNVTFLNQLEKVFNLRAYGGFKGLHKFEQAALKAGIGKGKGVAEQLSTDERTVLRLYNARTDGCDSCNHTGYKGRMLIYEILDNTEDLKKLVVSSASAENLQKAGIQGGMISMQLDGFIKALRGQTTIEEVLRVAGQE